MKSKFSALQCPCGCELAAEHRLELVYQYLVHAGFDVTGRVSCEGTNTQLQFISVHMHQDTVNKLLQQMSAVLCFKVAICFHMRDKVWIVDTAQQSGVLYA